MFLKLSKFATRYRLPIVFIWVAAGLALLFLAPKLSKVGVTDESQFLPQNTESAAASSLLKTKFAT